MPSTAVLPVRPPPLRPVPLALVMTSFEPGGTERQMTELIRRLDGSRWELHLACFPRRGAWFDQVARAARTVTTFPVRSLHRPGGLRAMCAFASWCRERRIGVVHALDAPAAIFALPPAAAARVPVRIANRRDLNPGRGFAELAAQRVAYAFANLVVANCRAAAHRLLRERVPAGKIAVVPNGVDLDACILRTNHVNERESRHIVCVGNLRPEKGQSVLLEAAALVLQDCPHARFEFIGDGPMLGSLRDLAAALRIAHAVSFSGCRNDVPLRLAGADLFVLPSRSEASPNAVLEAMGAALPIVASHVGGVPELIDHERTGLLVPPGDPHALAGAIRRLLRNPLFGDHLGRSARAVVEGQHSFDAMAAAFEAIYLDQLDRRAAATKRSVVDTAAA